MSELMKMSFEMRRNVIISEAKPLQDLLVAFPFLGDPEEVRTERHMLTTNFLVVILDYLGVVSHPLESPQFLESWKHQWLPRISKGITVTLTEPLLKKIKPLIYNIEDGFNDTDGKSAGTSLQLISP